MRSTASVAMLLALAVLMLASAGARATVQSAPAQMGRVGVPPLPDRSAAALVSASPELRPENAAANHRRPTPAQLARFHSLSTMPYQQQVTGAYSGTTDQIIQWAARKHHIPVDVARAVAAVESYWLQSTVGDHGDSFGLFQMRRPFHCCLPFMQRDTAFNADYWAAIIRAYYDGKQSFLTTQPGNGSPYQAGDLWGSIGAWASGRWHDATAETYIAQVKDVLRRRLWQTDGFRRYYTVDGHPVDRGPR